MPVGLFGKYPAKRDFVSVNMPRTILQPLEVWLAAALATSRDRLGRRWNDFYMVQPIWNFRLGAGVAGVECLGVMAPSIDAVGRAFPLAILGYCDAPNKRLTKSRAETETWLSDATSRLLLALSDTPPGEATDLLANLPEPDCVLPELPAGIVGDGKGYLSMWGNGDAELSNGGMDALHQAFALDHRTIWWCSGSNLVAAQTVSYDGFPDAEFGVRMMASASAPANADASQNE